MIWDIILDHSWQDLNLYIEYNYFDSSIAAHFPVAHHGLHILMVHLLTILTHHGGHLLAIMTHHGILAAECLLLAVLALPHLVGILSISIVRH